MEMIESNTPMHKTQTMRAAINFGLLCTCFAAAVSGFVIQVAYHMGHHGNIDEHRSVFGWSYSEWSAVHKIAVVIFSFLAAYHFAMHWRWYKTVIQKSLYGKNKTVTALTMVFIVVALTGYVPWFIDSVAGNQAVRKYFIEIHDKITFILFPLAVVHIVQKFSRLVSFFAARPPKKSTRRSAKSISA